MNINEELIKVAAEAIRDRDTAIELLNMEIGTKDSLRKQLAQIEDERKELSGEIDALEKSLAVTRQIITEYKSKFAAFAAERDVEVDKLARLINQMALDVDASDTFAEPEWLRLILNGNKMEVIQAIGGTKQLVFHSNLVNLIAALAKYWEVE